MKWHIFAIGKNKQDQYTELISIYQKRIKGKIPLEIKDFPNEKSLIKAIKKGWFIILMDEKGEMFSSSNKLAGMLGKKISQLSADIVFIIGGSYGASSELKNLSNYKLALSTLTFPHRMAKLFLVEQLYRILTILAGEPYSH
jgi:23S rRNA (pseudouridine1915-N3)-methyltransferase